jgi:hypothetical protein
VAAGEEDTASKADASRVETAGVSSIASRSARSSNSRSTAAGFSPRAFRLDGSIGTGPPRVDATTTSTPASTSAKYGTASSSAQRPVGLPVSPILSWDLTIISTRRVGVMGGMLLAGRHARRRRAREDRL